MSSAKYKTVQNHSINLQSKDFKKRFYCKLNFIVNIVNSNQGLKIIYKKNI